VLFGTDPLPASLVLFTKQTKQPFGNVSDLLILEEKAAIVSPTFRRFGSGEPSGERERWLLNL
jgi:hypothetical protein